MKRSFMAIFVLVLLSLACRTVEVGFATPTPTASATFTPSPLPTFTPTATATLPPPTLEPLTCTDDSCLDACLQRIKVVLETQPFTPIDEGQDESGIVSLSRYTIQGNSLTPLSKLGVPGEYLVYQQDVEAHNRIWDYFIAILPADQRRWISEFLIFTDGKSGIMAWVRRSPSTATKWTLGADILDSRNPIALTETLVHEFGHLLTLNTDQLTAGAKYSYVERPGTGACLQYSNSEGCANPDSYLERFYERFWKDIYPEWYTNVHRLSRGRLDWSLVSGFYRRYPDQFNTDYSAASPEEDLAESFVAFVVSPRPEGDSIAEQKILFFYDYPELVALRTAIIEGICSYVQE